MKRLLLLLSLLFAPLGALASTCPTYPYTLTNGQTADANQVMANFNSILSCANSNVATAGSNSNITALLGLTTPISVVQGGTGQTTAPVQSFNTRAGAVTLLSADVTSALGFTPLSAANNLSDVASASTARTNLGVTATGADVTYAYRANNLSDLASVTTARTNLGVTATGTDTTYAYRANNLSDLASTSAALNNLLPSQTSNSGKVLSTNGTTPSWSTLASLSGSQSIASPGYITLPGGLVMEWGTSSSIGSGTQSLAITFPLACPTGLYTVTVTPAANTGSGGMAYYYVTSASASGFTLNTAAANAATYYWNAICH